MNIKKQYYQNGNIECEFHFLNNEIHREDGPAIIWYDEHGNVIGELFCLNGKLMNNLQKLIAITKYQT